MKKGFLLLFLTGCATVQYPMATKFVEGPPEANIVVMKWLTAMAIAEVDREMPMTSTLTDKLEAIKIQWVNGKFPCEQIIGGKPGITCVGVFKPKLQQIVVMEKPDECLSSTALAHELMHAMLYNVRGDGDGKHAMTEYWNTALNNANRMYCETNCRGFCILGGNK